MTLKKITAIILALAPLALNAVTITPEAKQRAAELVAQMTLDEKLAYVGGVNGFYIRPIERLGIPAIRTADGPQGVRNDTKSTLYPCGIATAATWNRELARDYGSALGRDARARGVGIILGPGVNIYRSPLCGRNFEYFGEDPYLTSETAAAYIEGVQSQNVIATIKHFCGNNQEWDRHNTSSDIDERTLHEIYLPAFRKAVRQAGVGAVMSSYNPLNGIHTTENKELTDILRNRWGFDGIYMSDWDATYSTVGAAAAGLDLEMPGARFMTPGKLKKALENGTLTETVIDTKCRHILQTLIAFGLLNEPRHEVALPPRDLQSEATALNVAREAVVLLKNDGILPLSHKVHRIVVTGPNATNVPTGGGSGLVFPFESVSVAQGLETTAGRRTVDVITPRESTDLTQAFRTPDGQSGLLGRFFANRHFEGNPAGEVTFDAIDVLWDKAPVDGVTVDDMSANFYGTFTAPETGHATIRLFGDAAYRVRIDDKEVMADWWDHAVTMRRYEFDVTAGRKYDIAIDYYNHEGTGLLKLTWCIEPLNDRTKEIERADAIIYCAGFDSSSEGEMADRPFGLQKEQLDEITRLSGINPNIIVVINAGGGVDMLPFLDRSRAVLMAWYPGQEGGRAIAEILTGKVNPSGRLPISIERSIEDNPTFGSYRENTERIYKSPRRVSYDEGVFVGYRGYDRNNIEPLFPFGYGLSYTSFKYGNISVSDDGNGAVTVAFDIMNTGKMQGAEIAQIYVGDVEASVPRPRRELKGYEKVFLAPGQTKHIEIILPPEAFEYYDMDRHRFISEPGEFCIEVGASARDIRLTSLIRK